MTIDRFNCDTQADYEGGSYGVMRQESDGSYVMFDDYILAIKEAREKMHSECMAELGLLMLKELKKGAHEKTINTIDECSTVVGALIK